MDEDSEVVIIGAGICGLATALALHKKGIKSVVMERSESLRNVSGAAIIIQQNGWRALHQLGIDEILRQTALPIYRYRTISFDDRGRQKETSLIHWEGEWRCLRRKNLIDTLYAALPRGTVKFNCQVESIKLDPYSTKPVLRSVNGSFIRPKVVIGCDGNNSITADFLNLKPTKMFSLCPVRGLTTYPNGHPYDNEFIRLIKDNIVVARIPIDDNLVYWFCFLTYVPKANEKIWKDPELIRQLTIEMVRNHPQEIQEMVENADIKSLSLTHLRYRAPWDLLTGTCCKGTVAVAGDAMHAMGPFLGQGGAAALEDAIVLARIMAQRLGSNSDESGSKITVHGVEDALNLYVKERRMRVVLLSLQTYLIGTLSSTSSRIKKMICVMLLILLFYDQNSHMYYDCGNL
ncbi:hypothetical protein SSX86_007759 [Deinandra increscens subsp. villosa]|uniref:FAD-binding domain-containing protein n=1 Tax=Deinandra increscens subsp. villosa TaxID=3103831 RepID=A0AAP0DE24_9ASTR